MQCEFCCKQFEGSNFYRCVDCDVNFHVECIPLPRVVKNDKAHQHPLLLLSSLQLVYDSEKYCCDICRERGTARHHVYYCDDCKFIAHVECVLNEVCNFFFSPHPLAIFKVLLLQSFCNFRCVGDIISIHCLRNSFVKYVCLLIRKNRSLLSSTKYKTLSLWVSIVNLIFSLFQNFFSNGPKLSLPMNFGPCSLSRAGNFIINSAMF